jgi:hypothetical protein
MPQFGMLPESQETGCKQSAPCAEGKNAGAMSESADDELAFDGRWALEVIERTRACFDVPAAAVRRRTLG